ILTCGGLNRNTSLKVVILALYFRFHWYYIKPTTSFLNCSLKLNQTSFSDRPSIPLTLFFLGLGGGEKDQIHQWLRESET
ncbi:hypothetical protein VIGAN_08277000, partial [Vigna angularis var. angularis]